MAAKKLLNPPVLSDVDNIDSWLHDLQIWKCVTDLEKKQQGPAIYFSLSDKIMNSCSDVTVPELNKDDGLNLLINKLEKLYVKDSKASAYLAYEKFASFQCPTDMNIIDYLNEFERLYYDIQRYEMTLPSGVLAYRVLISANLTPEKQRLARATITEMTYENMKKQLKAIHDSSSSNSIDSFDIKSEQAFVNETKDEHTFYGNSSSNWGRFNS